MKYIDNIMRIITTVLILILLYLNWYRYHSPIYQGDISLFDLWSTISYSLLVLICLLRPRNLISEGLLVFTIVQAVSSVIDEILKMASHVGRSDDIWLVSAIIAAIIFCIVRYRIKPYRII